MSSGRIVQIIGAVIDVEFPRDSVPRVYDALKVDGKGLTLEATGPDGTKVQLTINYDETDEVAVRVTPSAYARRAIDPQT